jgi:hypothetical protein
MFTAKLDPSDFRKFQRTLQALADTTDRPVEEVLRQQGRLLAKDLAHWIMPAGLSPSIGRSFQDSIKASISRFYKPVGWLHTEVLKRHGEGAADSIVRLIRTGKNSEAQRLLNSRLRIDHPGAILVGPFDGGTLHRRHRWRRGTRRHTILIVTRFPEAAAYIRKVSKRAGLAKGALANAGRQLDGKSPGIPAWIRRHTSAPGRGHLSRHKDGFTGFLESLLPYARQALPLSHEIRAMDVREETAARQLKRIVDARIRKTMRGG